MVVDGGSEIMAGCGWSWVIGVKLWLVFGGGGKIMAEAVKLWLIVGDGGELMPGRGCSWVVVAKLWLFVYGPGWLHDLVI